MSHCITCVTNATGTPCECEDGWSGAQCEIWSGTCSDTCLSCTYSSGAEHCWACIANAVWDAAGCVCEADYTGTFCEEYTGGCASTCEAGLDVDCTGPGAEHCTVCVDNAHRDFMGRCICNDNFGENDCSSYSGQCHRQCDGVCSGPSSNHCTTCVVNSTPDADGFCVCDDNWGDSDCSMYLGPCSTLCKNCHGSSAIDCISCVDNASRDGTGACVCHSDWTGDDCSEWAGTCQDACAITTSDGCSGPEYYHCFECRENAVRDSNGGCVCHPDFGGSTCDLFTGSCDPKCLSCNSPDTCIDCVTNATLNVDDNVCECDENWTGSACDCW